MSPGQHVAPLGVAQGRRAGQHQQAFVVSELVLVGALRSPGSNSYVFAAEQLVAEQRPELAVVGSEARRGRDL
jgi:hypothetical protein